MSTSLSTPTIVTNLAFLITVKIIHVFGGIFIWEWVTSLGFEWEVYTGKRPWRWSVGVYIACRLSTLTAIVIDFIGFNLTSRYNCEAWLRTLLVFSYLATSLASLLIVLRAVAIWGRSKLVVVCTSLVWLINVGFAVYTVTRSHTSWTSAGCQITDTQDMRFGILINLCSDLINLCIMFLGVLNQKNHTHATPLWRVLYVQGIAWIFFASLSEVPPAVLSWLDISDAWNLMFQTPHLIIIVIVATRVYRDLSYYISPLQRAGPFHLPGPRRRRQPHPFDETFDTRTGAYGHGQRGIGSFTASGPAEVSIIKTIEVEVDMELSTAANPDIDVDPVDMEYEFPDSPPSANPLNVPRHHLRPPPHSHPHYPSMPTPTFKPARGHVPSQPTKSPPHSPPLPTPNQNSYPADKKTDPNSSPKKAKKPKSPPAHVQAHAHLAKPEVFGDEGPFGLESVKEMEDSSISEETLDKGQASRGPGGGGRVVLPTRNEVHLPGLTVHTPSPTATNNFGLGAGLGDVPSGVGTARPPSRSGSDHELRSRSPVRTVFNSLSRAVGGRKGSLSGGGGDSPVVEERR